MSFYTYILYYEKFDRYYIGSCQDMEVRLEQHNAGRNKSTKAGVPWVLKHTETFEARSAAAQRETQIKNKKSRKYVEWLTSFAG